MLTWKDTALAVPLMQQKRLRALAPEGMRLQWLAWATKYLMPMLQSLFADLFDCASRFKRRSNLELKDCDFAHNTFGIRLIVFGAPMLTGSCISLEYLRRSAKVFPVPCSEKSV
jgi:hypothetical protein